MKQKTQFGEPIEKKFELLVKNGTINSLIDSQMKEIEDNRVKKKEEMRKRKLEDGSEGNDTVRPPDPFLSLTVPV